MDSVNGLYTILINGELYIDVIADMNSTEAWSQGGMILTSLENAEACKETIQDYYPNDVISICAVTLKEIYG